MVYSWIIASYAAFTAVSYLILIDQSNLLLVCLSLVLFAAANLPRSDSRALLAARVGTLMLFQWFVNDWWCLFLYMLILGKHYYRSISLRHRRFVTAGYTAAFLAIAAPELWRQPPMQRWTSISLALVFFALGAVVIEYVVNRIKQADKLNEERSVLVSSDPLTGLPNFDEAHRRLEKLIKGGESLLLALIDCADLKAMNSTKGYHTGNLILKQIAELLTSSFPDAKLIARYGGDEFALALPQGEPGMIDHVQRLLDSELPKLSGIQMTYALACYPADADSKDALLLEAESRLYTKKREGWLEREEHLLRSEKMRVVGELASGMAHEIRNPLTAVKGFLQMSRSNGYNIEPWYGLIMDEIDRMSELTAEFLQFSKPSSADYRAQSLQSCIQRVIALTETEASRLGQQLVYEHPDEPIVLWMDPDKIVQLLLNLVKNAYEAMPGGGTLFIRLQIAEGRAIVEVQDTGVGIPSERLEAIFHPFFTTKDYGTGLGLSISHKIVQDHGGTLEVESVIDEGTKFVVAFPLPAAAAGAG